MLFAKSLTRPYKQDPNADMYEDTMYSARGISNSDHESYSRDTSKYVSQYGGTTEIYNPASGRFRDSGYGRKEQQPPAYDSSKQLLLNNPIFLVLLIIPFWLCRLIAG